MQLPVKDKSLVNISTMWHVVACPNLKKPLYSESAWHNLLASYFHTLRNKLYCKYCTPTSTELTPVRMEPDWLVSSFQSCDTEATKTGRHKNRWNSVLCLPVTYPSTWMKQQQLYLALQARTWSSLLGSGSGSCEKVSGYLYPPATIDLQICRICGGERVQGFINTCLVGNDRIFLPSPGLIPRPSERREKTLISTTRGRVGIHVRVVGRQGHPYASAHLQYSRSKQHTTSYSTARYLALCQFTWFHVLNVFCYILKIQLP